MLATSIPPDLIRELVRLYQHDPAQFFYVPAQVMASAAMRESIAELRNNGYIEEELRGIIRLTTRGYRTFQRELAVKKASSTDTQSATGLPAWA